MNFIGDILTFILGFGPGLITLISYFYFILNFEISWYYLILISPFFFIINFIFIIFVFRLLLPSLKIGVYPVGFNLGFLAWFSHSMLSRSIRIWFLYHPINSLALTRWLYWRALGAKVSYSISTSLNVTLHDAGVVQIGAKTMLAEDVIISGHLIRGDKLLLAPVKIGKNVFIGRNTYIGPRTRIGEKAWIGMNNTITGQVIPPNGRMEPRMNQN